MKRKLLSVLLILAMVLAILPVGAMAAEEEQPKGEFTYSRGLSVTITGYTDPNVTDLVIPETIEGRPVTEVDQFAFENCKSLKSVVFPENMRVIGMSAFEGCSNLAHIEFKGDYLDEIMDEAFTDCVSLTEVVVPQVDSLPRGFYGCKSLKTAILTEGTRRLAMSCFAACDNLELLYIPASVDIIDAAPKLENLTIIGLEGTTAERYASQLGYPFEAIEYPDYFADVTEGRYYSVAVEWASQRGITYGYGDGLFRPDKICTRWQMAMFLWRLNGSPVYSWNHEFVDVPESAIYYDAVQWAYADQIVKGYSDEYFAPNEPVTRAMVVTMIWRMDKPPQESKEPSFTDAKPGYYYKALAWAQEAGVAEGYPDGTFHPNETCTRGQIVTFLYRSMYYFYHGDSYAHNFIC